MSFRKNWGSTEFPHSRGNHYEIPGRTDAQKEKEPSLDAPALTFARINAADQINPGLTFGLTVLEEGCPAVPGGQTPSTGKAGHSASLRLVWSKGTRQAGPEAIRRIFPRGALIWERKNYTNYRWRSVSEPTQEQGFRSECWLLPQLNTLNVPCKTDTDSFWSQWALLGAGMDSTLHLLQPVQCSLLLCTPQLCSDCLLFLGKELLSSSQMKSFSIEPKMPKTYFQISISTLILILLNIHIL